MNGVETLLSVLVVLVGYLGVKLYQLVKLFWSLDALVRVIWCDVRAILNKKPQPPTIIIFTE